MVVAAVAPLIVCHEAEVQAAAEVMFVQYS